MISKIFGRKTRINLRPLALLIALVASTFAPVFASAATLTARSIALSSASAGATASYTVGFTPVADAGAYVIDFCSTSPVIGDTCTAPTGFDASAAASTTVGYTDVTGSTNQVLVAGTFTHATPVSVVITGIVNPSTAGAFYARIVTYDTKVNAQAYITSATPVPTAGATDNGGVALYVNNTVGVSGVVEESMTFCVSGAAVGASCASPAPTTPSLKLGETVGSTVALIPSAVSTGSVFTQISTNAATGAVVSLKSNAVGCGGLIRSGAPSACDILPALNTGVTAGTAAFGVKTATATGTSGASPTGTLEPVASTYYNNSTYGLHYVSGDATGITSDFGDPFLDTNSLPANNQNMTLTFGASVNNSTPAGLYSADLNLVATGKF